MILSINKKYLSIAFLLFFLFFSGKAEAATLYIKPSQTTVTVGNIFNVQVTVDTTGKVINNAESIVEFPKDLLEVVSVDKQASIFTLWVTEPNFSNPLGQASFNGGVPNPGFIGSGGRIVSITFRAKKVGTASLIFSDSAVRANDGLGTDVLSGKNGAEIKIVEIPVQKPVEVEPVSTLATMNIYSSTHPDQKKWYSKDDVALSWRLPKNATAIKTLIGTRPYSDPTVYYDSPITSKNIEDVEDGVWYFHANYLAGGVWSKAEHYKLQIDTTNPTDLQAESEKDDFGKIILNLKANDSLSGVDHFTVAPNSDKPLVVKADANGEASIEIPFSRAGEHVVTISAFDKAGNKTEIQKTVTSDFAAKLEIDSYPAKLRINESVEASGTAPYPYAEIRVSLKDSDGTVINYKVKSDSYSKFYLISQPVTKDGKHILWAEILNDEGEIKYYSDRLTIEVEEPLILKIGSYTIGLMKVLIPALILLIIFLLIALYGWYKFFSLYRRVRKESLEAEKILGKSFYILRKDIKAHIAKLKKAESKRKLTVEEIEFLGQFENELSEAEDVIGKEIGDIVNS